MKTLGGIVLTATVVSAFVACTPTVPRAPEEAFKPCTEKPGPDQCEIFRDLFQVVDRTTISLTESKRPNNARCCKTKEIDGELFEYCKNC